MHLPVWMWLQTLFFILSLSAAVPRRFVLWSQTDSVGLGTPSLEMHIMQRVSTVNKKQNSTTQNSATFYAFRISPPSFALRNRSSVRNNVCLPRRQCWYRPVRFRNNEENTQPKTFCDQPLQSRWDSNPEAIWFGMWFSFSWRLRWRRAMLGYCAI